MRRERKEIVFMFGAGAEMDFNLPSGNEFMKKTIFGESLHTPNIVRCSLKSNKTMLCDKNFKKRVVCDLLIQYINLEELSDDKKDDYNSLSTDVKEKIYSIYLINKSYVSDNKSDLNIQFDSSQDTSQNRKNQKSGKITIEDNQNFNKFYSFEHMEVLFDKFLNNKEYTYCDFDTCAKANFDRNTKSKEEYVEYKKIYEKLKSNEIKICAKGIEKYFISINDPKKYGINNYSKIVNLYWSIYYTITNDCVRNFDNCNELALKDKYTFEDIVKANRFIWNVNNLLKIKNIECNYYNKIKEYYSESDNYSIKAMTTNYTPFVYLLFNEADASRCDRNIAFLNGRLDMFENFKKLAIESCLSIGEDIATYMGNSFPFLLAQSMIKPIIHPYQIKEYHKAIESLENANFLVILGYGLNEDDNHVNALLKGCAVNCTVIIVVEDEHEKNRIKGYRFFKPEKVSYVYFSGKNNQTIIEEIFTIINN